MSSIQDVFSKNVRKYRKALHLSQEKLAELANLHRTYIGGIEQRRVNVSLKNVGKIAAALELDPALLFLSDQPMRSDAVEAEGGSAPSRDKGETVRREAVVSEAGLSEHALVSWHDGRVTIRPIKATNEDLTTSILTSLVLKGFRGEELADRYNDVLEDVAAFLDARI